MSRGSEEERKNRNVLFRKKDIRPESFDFSVSGEERSKRMRVRITDGKKEIILDMDKDAVLELFSGIMDSAPEVFEFEPQKKVRDIMYA